MNRPQLTFADLLPIITPAVQESAMREDILNRKVVFIVGIRGYEHPGKNQRGVYDDAICLVGPDHFEAFNGNTDPSKLIPHMATLVPGVYPYHKGIHGITHVGGGYPAFRPATNGEELPVTRDGEAGVSKGVAINIHCGGKWGTGSAGCQTLNPNDWHEFQEGAYNLLDQYNQKIIPYILIVWPTNNNVNSAG